MEEEQKIELSSPIVMIGGSAGSLSVLFSVLPSLPLSISAPIILVSHRHSGSEVLLEALLSARAGLPVCDVEEKESPLPGNIYVAPPDYHLLFEPEGSFALDRSEKVNYSRPSIDVSFESAARAFGSKVIALLLSGANADGAEGLYEIQQHGGVAIVQDPETAEVDYMPRCALQLFTPDYIAKPDEMAILITRLTATVGDSRSELI